MIKLAEARGTASIRNEGCGISALLRADADIVGRRSTIAARHSTLSATVFTAGQPACPTRLMQLPGSFWR